MESSQKLMYRTLFLSTAIFVNSQGLPASNVSLEAQTQHETRNNSLDEIIKEKIASQKDALLKSGNLKYIEGVSITSVPEKLSPLHASLGNIFFFLDKKYATFHKDYDMTHDEFVATVNFISSKLEGKVGLQSIARAVLSYETQKENRYLELLSSSPESSKAGYLAYLSSRYVASSDRSSKNIAEGIEKVVNSYGYVVNIKTLDSTTFDDLKNSLDKEETALLVPRSGAQTSVNAVTAVGYFLEGNNKYIIVHDPLSAQIKFVSGTTLMNPEDHGELAKRLADYLSNQQIPQDNIGSLQGINIFPGIRFLSSEQLNEFSTIIVGKPELDIKHIQELIKILEKEK